MQHMRHQHHNSCTGLCLSSFLFVVTACILLVFSHSHLASVCACTTIIVGRGATEDGCAMTTHNNDCEDCDVRIGIVPGTSNNPRDSICPIYPCGFEYPRYVGFDRGSMYHPDAALPEEIDTDTSSPLPFNITKPLGYIPASSTYRYIDGTYGMMNEYSLTMGESTCGAKIIAYSKAQQGDALFDISALTRIALQRCKTARCAVELMGELSEKYGYAGSEDPVESGNGLFEAAGEALTIIDARGEAWVFHILADPTGKSSVWAAQKVPEDHLAVIPNKFIIDRMNLSDTENFLASKSIRKIALDAGFLTPDNDRGDEAFEFSRAFALDYTDAKAPGDSLNTADSERRRWRIYSFVAPSAEFAPNQTARFPFSVKVEKKVSLTDMQAFMRDHYEGTPYDSTHTLAAGPFGNPNRYDRNSEIQPEVREGWFERTISIHRTSYSFVAVVGGRDGSISERQGILWFAHHSPQNSLYIPIFSSTLELPHSFSRGTLYRFSRDSAWWAFAAVANNAERMYGPIHSVIVEEQVKYEAQSRELVDQVHMQVRDLIGAGEEQDAIGVMTQFTNERCRSGVERWWKLLDQLTGMFRDGVRVRVGGKNESTHPPLIQDHIFYPASWLRQVGGYFDHGVLKEPKYPKVPIPNQVMRMKQQQQMQQQVQQEQVQVDTSPVTAASNVELVDHHAEYEHRQAVSSSSPPLADTSSWLRDHRRWQWVSLFSIVFLLVALVFFQFGRWWAAEPKQEYSEIRDVGVGGGARMRAARGDKLIGQEQVF